MIKLHAEETLAFHVKAAQLPPPEREYQFHNKRRFDFCWPDAKNEMVKF